MDQCKAVSTPMGAHFKLKMPTYKEYEEEVELMKDVPYQSAVGCIMYTTIGTIPYLVYPFGLVSRFMSKPTQEHCSAVKLILRYIQGTIDTRLCFRRQGEFVVKGYCDSDYAADLDHRQTALCSQMEATQLVGGLSYNKWWHFQLLKLSTSHFQKL